MVIIRKLLAMQALLLVSPAQAETYQVSKNETLLQLKAEGQYIVSASSAIITGRLEAAGKSEAIARADVGSKYANVSDKLVASGILASNVSRRSRVGAAFGFMGNESFAHGAEAEAKKVSTTPISVVVTDLQAIEGVRKILEDNGVESVEIEYAATDSKSADAKAVAIALANVKAKADNYAAALNMNIVRIVRVGDGAGQMSSMFGADYSQLTETMFKRLLSSNAEGVAEVQTTATVYADYVMAPK
jgi:uncharacterized protein YggE